MKKEKVKKEKVSLKQKVINKIQDKIQARVDIYTNDLIDKICVYIEKLACDMSNNYDLEQILDKVRNKEFLS